MKALTRLVLVVLLSGTLFAVDAVDAPAANAYSYTGCKWGNSTVTWRYSGSSSTVRDYFTSAAGKWNSANVDAYLVHTYSSSRNITAYYANYGNSGWDGQMSVTYGCPGGKFVSGTVTIRGNSHYLDSYGNRKRRGVLVHEFGHALGLAHTNSMNSCGGAVSIMYFETTARTRCSGSYFDKPNSDDKNGINALY